MVALTAEQMQARRGKITASIAAACLGRNPYRTPLMAWAEIMGRLDPDLRSDNARAQEGHQAEPMIANLYAAQELESIEELQPWGTELATFDDWLAATPDYKAIIRDGTGDDEVTHLVECKLVGQGPSKDWTDGAPEYVRIQAQVQYLCVGVPVVIAAWIHGRDSLYLESVEGCPTDLLADLSDWRAKHIVGGVQPEADPERDKWTLLEVHQDRPENVYLDPTDAQLAMVRERCELAELVRVSKRRMDAIDTALLEQLGSAATGLAVGEQKVHVIPKKWKRGYPVRDHWQPPYLKWPTKLKLPAAVDYSDLPF